MKNININRQDGIKKNLKTLTLIPKAIEADEISVIDEMPTIGFETDKLVYTPSEDILATGGSAEDVLNNVIVDVPSPPPLRKRMKKIKNHFLAN